MKHLLTIVLISGGTVETIATAHTGWRWIGIAMMLAAVLLYATTNVPTAADLLRALRER